MIRSLSRIGLEKIRSRPRIGLDIDLHAPQVAELHVLEQLCAGHEAGGCWIGSFSRKNGAVGSDGFFSVAVFNVETELFETLSMTGIERGL